MEILSPEYGLSDLLILVLLKIITPTPLMNGTDHRFIFLPSPRLDRKHRFPPD